MASEVTEKVLFRCRVRGTTREGDRIRMSFNWAVARWASLTLTATELICGDWVIPYSEIQEAALVSIPMRGNFGVARRLVVRGNGGVYQFILPFVSVWGWPAKTDPFWDGPLPFRVERVTKGMERSWGVSLVMLIIIGCLVWNLMTPLVGQ